MSVMLHLNSFHATIVGLETQCSYHGRKQSLPSCVPKQLFFFDEVRAVHAQVIIWKVMNYWRDEWLPVWAAGTGEGQVGRIVLWSGRILFRYLITINWKSDSWAVLKHAFPCSLVWLEYIGQPAVKKEERNAFEIVLIPNLWTWMNFWCSAVLFVDRYSYGGDSEREGEMERETEIQRKGERDRETERGGGAEKERQEMQGKWKAK